MKGGGGTYFSRPKDAKPGGRGRKRVLRAGASREMVSLPIQKHIISYDTDIYNFFRYGHA